VPDFKIGDTASFSKTLTAADVALFVAVSGDTNPLHLDAAYAELTRFGRRVVHGALTASLISTVIGTKLPGEGAIYAGQSLRFVAPVFLDDTVTATATITEYDEETRRLVLRTVCCNQNGEEVVVGEAVILYRPVRD